MQDNQFLVRKPTPIRKPIFLIDLNGFKMILPTFEIATGESFPRSKLVCRRTYGTYDRAFLP